MLLNTPVCDFGWQAPDFTLPDTGNRLHKLDSLIGPNGLLIAFICNHCPYVKAIIDRLVSDATALQQRGINTENKSGVGQTLWKFYTFLASLSR